jgi:hypothetical protein
MAGITTQPRCKATDNSTKITAIPFKTDRVLLLIILNLTEEHK